MIGFLKRHRLTILLSVLILAVVAVAEFAAGRSFFGPDGRFGWWEPSIWSSANSQRVADAYTFSHIIHGILFYAFLWWVARKLPLGWIFLIALVIEGGWEILENSPLIIDRYREATIAQGYVGDSVMNSLADCLAMALGFLFAWRFPVWASVALVLVLEIGCLLWVRDNLTLNVVMLVWPQDALKEWQSVGAPGV
ncbi:MAG TPA: DUF2585 family protein [Candidatus Paceibacterota bacterium]